ncbi:MAG TPA: chromosomal replication initiator protein DnaA [Thermodesulfobacteriota bacterium]
MESLWDAARETLRQTVPPQAFELWIRPLKPVALDEDALDLAVPDAFFGEVVAERFRQTIERALAAAGGRPLAVRFAVAPEVDAAPAPAEPAAAPLPPRSDTSLNPAYTFESFVVGSGNQFAHAACLAVGQGTGRTYNPLFLYGGVGLGKTHLINAIGHAVLARRPTARICYVSAERFTNELISAIQNNKMHEFNNRYRNAADVLLVDDIQFIAGKERTQEAFFHTFNTLHAAGKQICLTSDRSPKEISGLEERLRTRFEWGLIADVQPPDMETKVAILKRKAASQGIALPDDVALFLAQASSSNIRELEGFLTRICAKAELEGEALTLDVARQALQDLLPRRERELTVDDVIHAVANHFKVRVSDLKGARKLQAFTLPRQTAMYLARTCTKASFPEIGDRFGGKDHSTVIHAVNRVKGRMEEDAEFRRTVERIRASLEA